LPEFAGPGWFDLNTRKIKKQLARFHTQVAKAVEGHRTPRRCARSIVALYQRRFLRPQVPAAINMYQDLLCFRKYAERLGVRQPSGAFSNERKILGYPHQHFTDTT
jgi:hypothetical protein